MDENKDKPNETQETQQQSENHYTPLVNNTAANPYKEQQYLPGQTIGYGLPTDQKVINYSDANKPVRDYTKLKRTLLIAFLLVFATVCTYLIYFLVKKFIFS